MPRLASMNSECRLSHRSSSIFTRLVLTESCTWSFRAAAGVPALREYGKMWMNAGLTLSFRKLYVSMKSSSVSPGKPVITSIPKNTFGPPGCSIAWRMRLILPAKNSVSYLLFMAFRMVSDPDWSGIWKCGRNFVPDAIQSTMLSVRRFGSMEDILYLSMPSTSLRAFRRSRKLSPVLFPKSPVFTPVRTISFMPSAAISLAWATMSFIGMLRLRPLA